MDTRHPPFHRIADLAEGLLEGPEQVTVQRHVSSCEHCSEDLNWLNHAIGLMRTDRTESAAEHVVNRAVRLFAQHRIQARPKPAGMLQRLIGVLRFDSAAAATPAFGLRVGADEGTRQMLFGAEPYEVELRARTTPDGTCVAGQVLGPIGVVEAPAVELIGKAVRVQAPLTELLEFSLQPVPPGIYRLELRLDRATWIEIPSLPLA